MGVGECKDPGGLEEVRGLTVKNRLASKCAPEITYEARALQLKYEYPSKQEMILKTTGY